MASPSCLYDRLPASLPMDEDGFIQSFESLQREELKEFYDRFGFVVISNAISPEQADATYSEIWDLLETASLEYHEQLVEKEKTMRIQNARFKGFLKPKKNKVPLASVRTNVDTWDELWPSKKGKGLVGKGVVSGPAAWNNRQSENIYDAFATVIGTKELMVSCDRYGFMRPTVQVPFSSGPEDRDEWRTTEAWVHWDLNPWYWTGLATPVGTPSELLLDAWKTNISDWIFITENNDVSDFNGYDKVQGLVAVADSKEDDGGFCCVPGFQKILKEWAENTEIYNKGHFVSVKKEDELISHLKNIPMRKGSCVIWSSALPHCNYPNRSSNIRACQYIKLFPREVIPEEIREYRREAVKSLIHPACTITSIGEKVFDLGD